MLFVACLPGAVLSAAAEQGTFTVKSLTPEAAPTAARTAMEHAACRATRSPCNETQAGKAMSGLRSLPRVLAAAGGLTIEAGGTLLGGIGVSGAPGGEADDGCARAGIGSIADSIEF